MMTVIEGVDASKKHLATLLPELTEADLTLEEAEVKPFGSVWRFTFSAMLPLSSGASLTLAQITRGRRITKTIEIDPQTGDLLALTNAA